MLVVQPTPFGRRSAASARHLTTYSVAAVISSCVTVRRTRRSPLRCLTDATAPRPVLYEPSPGEAGQSPPSPALGVSPRDNSNSSGGSSPPEIFTCVLRAGQSHRARTAVGDRAVASGKTLSRRRLPPTDH